jgi:hypothetical protein
MKGSVAAFAFLVSERGLFVLKGVKEGLALRLTLATRVATVETSS